MLRNLMAFPLSCSLLETQRHSSRFPLFCFLLLKMVTVTARRLRGTYPPCKVATKQRLQLGKLHDGAMTFLMFIHILNRMDSTSLNDD